MNERINKTGLFSSRMFWRIFAVSIIASSVTLIVFFFQVSSSYESEMLASMEIAHDKIAEKTAKEVSLLFEQAFVQLRMASSIVNYLKLDNHDLRDMLVAIATDAPYFANLKVADANGSIAAAASSGTESGIKIDYTIALENALKKEKWVSNPYFSHFGEGFITISTFIRIPDGSVGAIIAEVSLKKMWWWLDETKQLEGMLLALVDSSTGAVIAHQVKTHIGRIHPFWTSNVQKGVVSDFEGKKYISHNRVEGAPVEIVLESQMDTLLARLYDLRFSLSTSALTLFIVSTLWSLWGASRALNPLYKLIDNITHYGKTGSWPADHIQGEYGQIAQALQQSVSDRQKAEEALRESRERFRCLSESAFEGICVHELGEILDINQTFADMTGYKMDEMLKKTLFDFIAPESREAAFKNILFEYKHPYEVIGLKKDGTKFPMELQGRTALYKGSTARVEAARDITARKKAEEELIRLSKVIEQTVENIVITDTDGNIQYVNPAFESLSGYKFEEVKGHNPRFLKSGKHDEEFYKNLWDTITAGKVWRGRFINSKKDGTLYEEDAIISPIVDSSGAIACYVAIKRDITREIMLEKQMRQAQKMEAIGTLAGGVAHDFNNILQAIIGFSRMALERIPENNNAAECIESIIKASGRARDLARNILTFSRKREHARKPLELGQSVREGLRIISATLPANIRVKEDIDSSTGFILADTGEINQLIMNLCANAAQSMGENEGTLTISVKAVDIDENFSAVGHNKLLLGTLQPGEYLRLSVKDTGVGISPAIMDRIFEPFFTTKEVGEGTGLGLATVHGIVTSLNGAIYVESEPSAGATFHVFFPRANADIMWSKPGQGSHAGRIKGARVLFVDDEEMISFTCKIGLESLGYRVTSVTNSFAAAEMFRNNPNDFDIVISDQTMPRMTGVELALTILSIRHDIPFILCSGFERSITPDKLQTLGIREFINKPYEIEALGEAIERHLAPQIASAT